MKMLAADFELHPAMWRVCPDLGQQLRPGSYFLHAAVTVEAGKRSANVSLCFGAGNAAYVEAAAKLSPHERRTIPLGCDMDLSEPTTVEVRVRSKEPGCFVLARSAEDQTPLTYAGARGAR
jgi:hypothetical protein